MSRCKYFTDEETINLTDDLCQKIDKMREMFGYPIMMTSGYRTPEHNAEIGGVADSAHVKGMAVDIAVPSDQFMREKLAWAIGCAQLIRVEDALRHWHVDVDYSKPTPAFYQGVDK